MRVNAGKLLILPFNTKAPKRVIHNILPKGIQKAFGGIYEGCEVLPREIADTQDYPPSHTYDINGTPYDVFVQDADSGEYSILNCFLGYGLHPILYERFGTQHLLLITDMSFACGGLKPGGSADEETGKAMMTTYEMPFDEFLGQWLLGVAIHELGHLFGLEHHDAKIGDKFCPMINRGDFKTEERRLEFLDSRSSEFCDSCKKNMHSVSLII